MKHRNTSRDQLNRFVETCSAALLQMVQVVHRPAPNARRHFEEKPSRGGFEHSGRFKQFGLIWAENVLLWRMQRSGLTRLQRDSRDVSDYYVAARWLTHSAFLSPVSLCDVRSELNAGTRPVEVRSGGEAVECG